MTPTQRSLELLRKNGYIAEVVERYNSFSRTRHDLFNIGDILAIRSGEVLLVQTTSGGNAKARVNKIIASEHIHTIVGSGINVCVHGWRKLKHGSKQVWSCREIWFNPDLSTHEEKKR